MPSVSEGLTWANVVEDSFDASLARAVARANEEPTEQEPDNRTTYERTRAAVESNGAAIKAALLDPSVTPTTSVRDGLEGASEPVVSASGGLRGEALGAVGNAIEAMAGDLQRYRETEATDGAELASFREEAAVQTVQGWIEGENDYEAAHAWVSLPLTRRQQLIENMDVFEDEAQQLESIAGAVQAFDQLVGETQRSEKDAQAANAERAASYAAWQKTHGYSDEEARARLERIADAMEEDLDLDLGLVRGQDHRHLLELTDATLEEVASAHRVQAFKQSFLNAPSTSVADGFEYSTPWGPVRSTPTQVAPQPVRQDRIDARVALAMQRRETADDIKASLLAKTPEDNSWDAAQKEADRIASEMQRTLNPRF